MVNATLCMQEIPTTSSTSNRSACIYDIHLMIVLLVHRSLMLVHLVHQQLLLVHVVLLLHVGHRSLKVVLLVEP